MSQSLLVSIALFIVCNQNHLNYVVRVVWLTIAGMGIPVIIETNRGWAIRRLTLKVWKRFSGGELSFFLPRSFFDGNSS